MSLWEVGVKRFDCLELLSISALNRVEIVQIWVMMACIEVSNICLSSFVSSYSVAHLWLQGPAVTDLNCTSHMLERLSNVSRHSTKVVKDSRSWIMDPFLEPWICSSLWKAVLSWVLGWKGRKETGVIQDFVVGVMWSVQGGRGRGTFLKLVSGCFWWTVIIFEQCL